MREDNRSEGEGSSGDRMEGEGSGRDGRENNRSEVEGSRGDRREGEGSGGDGRENNRSEGEGSGRDNSKGVGSGGDRREGVRTECDGGDRKEELFCSSDRGGEEESEVLVGDSIVRKTDRVLNKGDDVVVCLPGAKIEAITERVKNIVGSGKGGSVLVHVGTNNVEREGTTAIVRKYRQLVRTLKQTRVEQVILSGILPVMGRRGHKYRNCRGWQLIC